ncbi:hypothetical protein [Nocardioides sp. W7]|uniref:hypothetical protein n=1 Tax=Nocardioides sp. W7 TaxID=2931390 RepID=UPI001FD18812|nr:hypothetical protein [Nocardioides sp. W7]
MRTSKRQYVVTVSDGEAARLRAFDNQAEGRQHWPLGENRTFMRRNETTFVVKEMTSVGIGQGAVATTLGTATLRPDHRVDVVVKKTKVEWLNYLLIASGLACLAVTPRDGVPAAVLGVALLLAGWFLRVSRTQVEHDLDQVEQVLRSEINGDWVPALADSRHR